MTRAMETGWALVAVVFLAACGGPLPGEDSTDGSSTSGGAASAAGGASSGLASSASSSSSGGSNGAPDAGPGRTRVKPDLPDLPALDRELNGWSFHALEGMRCADGDPTGVGFNPASTDTGDVMLFLQGGGACWTGDTCWGPLASAMYVRTGYGALEFALDVMRPVMVPLQRNNPFNPFNAMHMVYVPYCTGDVHAGSRVTTYTYFGREYATHHVGYDNVGHVLERMATTFPDMQRLFLVGDSAGGFGVALNMDRVQRRFPGVEVAVLDDSGQPIEPGGSRWTDWQEKWNLQFPSGCTDCTSGVTGLVTYLRGQYPDSRFGLVSFSHDSVISTFMGLDIFTFNSRLEAAVDGLDGNWPGAHYYLVPGTGHVAILAPSPGLLEWMTDFVAGDPGWTSRRGL